MVSTNLFTVHVATTKEHHSFYFPYPAEDLLLRVCVYRPGDLNFPALGGQQLHHGMSVLEGMNAAAKAHLLGTTKWVNGNLIEVFSCSSHLLPGFIKQLDADAEELLPSSVMGEEHGVVVIAAFIS